MKNSFGVRLGERVCNFYSNSEYFVEVTVVFPIRGDLRLEVAACYVFSDQISAIVLAGIIEADNMWVTEPGERSRFAPNPLQISPGEDVGFEHTQRDVALKDFVPCQKYFLGSSFAEPANQCVSISELEPRFHARLRRTLQPGRVIPGAVQR